jgi:hypothetical protein
MKSGTDLLEEKGWKNDVHLKITTIKLFDTKFKNTTVLSHNAEHSMQNKVILFGLWELPTYYYDIFWPARSVQDNGTWWGANCRNHLSMHLIILPYDPTRHHYWPPRAITYHIHVSSLYTMKEKKKIAFLDKYLHAPVACYRNFIWQKLAKNVFIVLRRTYVRFSRDLITRICIHAR